MNLTVIIASFISGLLGAMGFGGGSVLIIYLTTFTDTTQKEAQGINLIFFVAASIFSIIINFKNKIIDRKEAFKMLPLSVAGLIAGYILLPMISAEILRKLFGGALIILGLKELLSRKNKISHRR